MKTKYAWQILTVITVLVMVLGLLPQAAKAAPASNVTFAILHTNDFHGQLEWKSGGSSSNPGLGRLAAVVNAQRTALGAGNVLLMDAGDEMQGSLLSNIQYGEPTIAAFNALGYNAATFGNHEFDWGKTILGDRVAQANHDYVSANIVVNNTGNCATAGWTSPSFVDAPYEIYTVGDPVSVKVAVIGVTTPEVPIITIPAATEGLCFKDPADSIMNYYNAMKADGADVIVVLSHLGYADGGYGYGIPIYGDQTLAKKLNDAGKPVNLIIGGHSHTSLATATMVGNTAVVQAAYNARRLGKALITVTTTGAVTVNWSYFLVPTGAGDPVDPTVQAVIDAYATDPDYLALINQEVGWTDVPLTRNYDGDGLMGYFVNDAIYNDLNNDADLTNDVDMVFNNSGGLRTDIVCAEYPCKLTYGMLYTILPFGNQTIVGTMTGEQILELLHQAASLNKGAIQVAGMRYSFFNYRVDTNPDPATTSWKSWSWGAFDACVIDKSTELCEPLELDRTYTIATNEFLAPAGQDNFYAFKYVKDITYWGDMLDGVIRWVSENYPETSPYNDAIDGRINREGDDTFDTEEIIPLTILHHNDMHGNLYKGAYVGYTQLATLIKQERAYNPTRTLLLNSGDNIQGDGFSFYYKTAPLGYTADGTVLDPSMQIAPVILAMNEMDYDAMTIGNHEYNFGSEVFKAVLGDANFPLLQANVEDDGSYGITEVPVEDYVEKTVEGINIAILGIGNHRIPNYELPSNIPGLTFTDPLVKAQELSDALRATNDVVIALTHIGFTEDPKSVEVDKNVDTNMAATVTGLDAIIGGHSHTDPSKGFGAAKYLPTYVVDPDGKPVIINHAYRYNNTLGEIFIGVRAKDGGGYEVVSQAGQYLTVGSSVVEDTGIKALLQPYIDMFTTYNNTVIGQTTAPIDALLAYTQETNGANIQADAAIHELESNSIDVDFHLSGAMSNRKVADAATPSSPVSLKISDMFTLMPYENSLVVMSMNGPQLKAVLERAYRNYYYYKYVPGYGGYSYYTTCMIDTNFGNVITYNDISEAAYDPTKSYVVSLNIGGEEIDFTDAETYYNVSTVNYLAAGSCNFNNAGVTLWPLDQIVADTQYYVRDSVINYITDTGTVSPAIEGRLQFIHDLEAPTIDIDSPVAWDYTTPGTLTIDFDVVDVGVAGLLEVEADIDGTMVEDGDIIDLSMIGLGAHTFTVHATDKAMNHASKSVNFNVLAASSFESTFSKNAKGWTVVNGNWFITTKGYYKTNGTINALSSIIHAQDFTSVTIEAKMRRKFGDTALPNRLHFRVTPEPLDSAGQWMNGYMFQYTNAGKFSIWKFTDGKAEPLVGWVWTPEIVPYGWNVLKVVANDGDMEFYINDVLVAAGHDESFTVGRVGISTWRGSDVKAPFLLDWVKVSNTAYPEVYTDPIGLVP